MAELLRVHLRLPERQSGDQLRLGERLVHLRLHLRLAMFGGDAGRRRLLLQIVVLRLNAEVQQRGFGGLDLQRGVLELLIELRIDELQDHGVRLHRRARVEEDPLDASLGRGGDPADVLRHERAGTAHLAQRAGRA